MLDNIFTKKTKRKGNRVLTWLLIIVLALSILGVIYIATVPYGTTDPSTEFYILGSEDASDYPTNLTVEENGEFTVGIINNGDQGRRYTIRLVIDQDILEERSVEVPNQHTWEDEFQFSIDEEGTYKLEILLFVGDHIESSNEPYRELYLWVTITEEEPEIQEPIEIPQQGSSNESI